VVAIPKTTCGAPEGGDRIFEREIQMAGAYCNLLYHLVFSTKERRPLISAAMKPRLLDYVGGIVRSEGGELLEINAVPDHVHLLVRLHPTRAVADMLRIIKANSSKWANEKFHRGPAFAWQNGYAAFTVSQSQVPRLVPYIRGQEEHHRKRDFRRELIALLRRNEIECDEHYLL
jgi:putative transposase